MSVTRTFTVTVANAGGNKYFIDSVQQATILLGEGGTYKFDQSDSSNGNHPLRFSTTSGGTHSGGSQYTTGVTTNGSPGNAGAYTQITVAESAPTLYYYCTAHSGMGGQANTVDDNSYGMWAWGTNEWGDQGPVEIALSGQSATSSVGSVTVTDIQTVIPTGQSTTSSVGSIISSQLSIVDLTGVSATSEVGDFDNAGTLVGWGRNGWGEEPYGDSFNKLVQPTGLSLTSSLGSLVATPETIASLTGLSSTSAVGSLSFIISPVVVPTGQSATTSVGTVLTSDAIGLTGLGMTSEVGSITPADVMGLTGRQVNTQVGNLIEETATFVTPTGVSATSSVGSLVSEIGVPLSGVSATSAVGSLSFTFSMDLTLTGVQATTELNDDLILKYFGKITPKDSTGYTTKTPKNSTGYTTKTA